MGKGHYYDAHEIRWEEPRSKNDVTALALERAERWKRVKDQLKLRPGKWAVIAEMGDKKPLIKSQIMRSLDEEGFEVTTRREGETTFAYARWVGEE